MTLTEFQLKFLRGIGHERDADFIAEYCPFLVPQSPEEQGQRHMIGSTQQALWVIEPLEQGNRRDATGLLRQYRNQAGNNYRGLAKETLAKLQGLEIIDDLYRGQINRLSPEKLADIRTTLERIVRTGRQ